MWCQPPLSICLSPGQACSVCVCVCVSKLACVCAKFGIPYTSWCAGFPLTNLCLTCLLVVYLILWLFLCLVFVFFSSHPSISLSVCLIQSANSLSRSTIIICQVLKQIHKLKGTSFLWHHINSQSRHIFQSLTKWKEIMFDRLCNFLWCFPRTHAHTNGTLNYSS